MSTHRLALALVALLTACGAPAPGTDGSTPVDTDAAADGALVDAGSCVSQFTEVQAGLMRDASKAVACQSSSQWIYYRGMAETGVDQWTTRQQIPCGDQLVGTTWIYYCELMRYEATHCGVPQPDYPDHPCLADGGAP